MKSILVEKSEVRIDDLVREVVTDTDLEARSQGRGVTLHETKACSIFGNAGTLRSALENVIRNAISYSGERSEVEVSLTCHQNGQDTLNVIQVRDHGPGVADTALVDLFRPFYRIDNSRERKTGGVGLGRHPVCHNPHMCGHDRPPR